MQNQFFGNVQIVAEQPRLYFCELYLGPFDGGVGVALVGEDDLVIATYSREYNQSQPFHPLVQGLPVHIAVYRWDGNPRSSDRAKLPYRFNFVESVSSEEVARRLEGG